MHEVVIKSYNNPATMTTDFIVTIPATHLSYAITDEDIKFNKVSANVIAKKLLNNYISHIEKIIGPMLHDEVIKAMNVETHHDAGPLDSHDAGPLDSPFDWTDINESDWNNFDWYDGLSKGDYLADTPYKYYSDSAMMQIKEEQESLEYAASIKQNISVENELKKAFPAINAMVVNPVTKHKGALRNVIINLNDVHEWSREKVADWIETLDIDITAAESFEEAQKKMVDGILQGEYDDEDND